MNVDIRLSVEFWRHPKTKKLIRRTGLEGARSLQILWLWAAVNRPDGDLAGLDDEAVELAADWEGEEGKFVQTLVSIAFLDGTTDAYTLHGWQENNSWAASEPSRGDKGRFSKLKSMEATKDVAQELEAAGVSRISKNDYAALMNDATRRGTLERLLKEAQRQSQEQLQDASLGDLGVAQGDPVGTQQGTLGSRFAPAPAPTPAPNAYKEHAHDGSHDFFRPAPQQGACAHPAPLSGEEIADRQDAARAQMQRGQYEFNVLRDAYDRVKTEAPQTGFSDFLQLFNSSEWRSDTLDEILAGLDALAKGDRQFLGEERFRPGLGKFITSRMWRMKPRSPDGKSANAEQDLAVKKKRAEYKAKREAQEAERRRAMAQQEYF